MGLDIHDVALGRKKVTRVQLSYFSFAYLKVFSNFGVKYVYTLRSRTYLFLILSLWKAHFSILKWALGRDGICKSIEVSGPESDTPGGGRPSGRKGRQRGQSWKEGSDFVMVYVSLRQAGNNLYIFLRDCLLSTGSSVRISVVNSVY